MRVLERLRVLGWWFAGRMPCWLTDGEARACVCGWCGDELGLEGDCDRCAELDARTIAFFDE